MSFIKPQYATIEEMQAWAAGVMVRAPDFVIGNDYLRRWWIVPRSGFCNVYLHQILRSDDDRALHDHPWANTSCLIAGRYIEHTPEGSFLRQAGDVVERSAETLHRLELIDGIPAISLFMTGPKSREWGFACPKGWVHWRDFADPDNPGMQGNGCGEHDVPEGGGFDRLSLSGDRLPISAPIPSPVTGARGTTGND